MFEELKELELLEIDGGCVVCRHFFGQSGNYDKNCAYAMFAYKED